MSQIFVAVELTDRGVMSIVVAAWLCFAALGLALPRATIATFVQRVSGRPATYQVTFLRVWGAVSATIGALMLLRLLHHPH